MGIIFSSSEIEGEYDPKKAFRWFTQVRACVPLPGDRPVVITIVCMFNLGVLRLDQAADKGVRESMYELALAYAAGRGCKRNYVLAHQWMGKSASKGLAEAQFQYSLWYVCPEMHRDLIPSPCALHIPIEFVFFS